MSANVEEARGEVRKFTAQEVGMIIRMYRERMGLKRSALAADAKLNEKTLERAESGEPINESSRRRIATALGMQPDSFTRELFIPTVEEAARIEKADAEEREKTHSAAPVRELRGARDVLPLFGGCALLGDDQSVKEEHLEKFAALKQLIVDWSDISGDIEEPDRISAAENVLESVREFEALGYVVKGNVVERFVTGGPYAERRSKWPISFVVAFRKPKGARDTTPAEVWLPKNMPMNF